jgi:hypothetical protein
MIAFFRVNPFFESGADFLRVDRVCWRWKVSEKNKQSRGVRGKFFYIGERGVRAVIRTGIFQCVSYVVSVA